MVHATQAGLRFGLTLIPLILIACLTKYPFFALSIRYTVTTKQHVLFGFKKHSSLGFYSYFVYSLLSCCIISAAVTLVCAGFLSQLPVLSSIPFSILTLFIILIAALLLLKGQHKALALISQMASLCMLLFTFITFALLLLQHHDLFYSVPLFRFPTLKDIAFIASLIAWMPSTLEISPWNSFWVLSDMKKSPKKSPSFFLKEFKLGYTLCTVLAILFLVLSTFILYGETQYPQKASDFLCRHSFSLHKNPWIDASTLYCPHLLSCPFWNMPRCL